MSLFIKRLEKNIARCEKEIEKLNEKISELQKKCEDHKITKAGFNIKKGKYEERIHGLNSRIRVLRGGIAREKRKEEEKQEKKEKEKAEKEKKKEE